MRRALLAVVVVLMGCEAQNQSQSDGRLAGGAALTAGQCHAKPGSKGKVKVCHATGSATNPYVLIRVAEAGCANGHEDHRNDRIVEKDDDCPAGSCSAAGGVCGSRRTCCTGLTCKPGEDEGEDDDHKDGQKGAGKSGSKDDDKDHGKDDDEGEASGTCVIPEPACPCWTAARLAQLGKGAHCTLDTSQGAGSFWYAISAGQRFAEVISFPANVPPFASCSYKDFSTANDGGAATPPIVVQNPSLTLAELALCKADVERVCATLPAR